MDPRYGFESIRGSTPGFGLGAARPFSPFGGGSMPDVEALIQQIMAAVTAQLAAQGIASPFASPEDAAAATATDAGDYLAARTPRADNAAEMAALDTVRGGGRGRGGWEGVADRLGLGNGRDNGREREGGPPEGRGWRRKAGDSGWQPGDGRPPWAMGDMDREVKRARHEARRAERGGRGASANADGGTFTHGDIDAGTQLDVDVSGGRAVERDGGRRRRRRRNSY
jgi:hypothetical protein